MGEETVREIREICCRVTELRYKDVISVEEGKGKFLGLLGNCEEYVISWKDIVIIGEDAILVRFCRPHREPKPPKKAFFENLFQ